jgi:hypothetical protein
MGVAALPVAARTGREGEVLRGMARLSVQDKNRSLASIKTIYQQIVDI